MILPPISLGGPWPASSPEFPVFASGRPSAAVSFPAPDTYRQSAWTGSAIVFRLKPQSRPSPYSRKVGFLYSKVLPFPAPPADFPAVYLHYPEEIHQFPLDIIVDLKFAGFLPQQYSTAAAEDFNIASEFPWEHGQDNRQQVCLISNAGYGCSDRLSHAPFIIETAGTVPAVRLLYRPLSLVTCPYWEHLSLNLRRSFIFITPSMVLKHRTSIA